jgi:TfoX/Sxy family transcriptional regulator of competence genes
VNQIATRARTQSSEATKQNGCDYATENASGKQKGCTYGRLPHTNTQKARDGTCQMREQRDTGDETQENGANVENIDVYLVGGAKVR